MIIQGHTHLYIYIKAHIEHSHCPLSLSPSTNSEGLSEEEEKILLEKVDGGDLRWTYIFIFYYYDISTTMRMFLHFPTLY